MKLPDLSQLSSDQLRQLAAALMTRVEQQDQVLQEREQALDQSQQALRHSEQRNQQLPHELALLKRRKFGQRSEHLNVLQISMLDEVVDAAIEAELEVLVTPATPLAAKRQPKRTPLPAELRETLLAEPVLHADETPVPMLVPGKKKTQKAYLWAYATMP